MIRNIWVRLASLLLEDLAETVEAGGRSGEALGKIAGEFRSGLQCHSVGMTQSWKPCMHSLHGLPD